MNNLVKSMCRRLQAVSDAKDPQNIKTVNKRKFTNIFLNLMKYPNSFCAF